MNATRKSQQIAGLSRHQTVVLALALAVLLGIAALVMPRLQSSVMFSLSNQAPAANTQSNASRRFLTSVSSDKGSVILDVDHTTGNIQAQFDAYAFPSALRSSYGARLYVVSSDPNQSHEAGYPGTLTVYDITSQSVVWRLELPGRRDPYLRAESGKHIWESTDGKIVFVMMGAQQGKPHPRLVAVNIDSRQVINESVIELPFDSREEWPRFWKMQWADKMVIVSYDQVLQVDMLSGKIEQVHTIPGFDSPETRARIPLNVHGIPTVEGGAIADGARLLVMATNTQQIITVDLNGSFTSKVVYALPTGWQFALNNPLTASSDGRITYVAVRRNESVIDNIRSAEEVWRLDMAESSKKPTPILQNQEVTNILLTEDETQLIAVSSRTQQLTAIDLRTLQPRTMTLRSAQSNDSFSDSVRVNPQ